MFEVKAVANGYYGNKIRIPGEAFGIDKVEHFSIEWMDTADAKVLGFVRDQAKLKGKIDRDMTTDEKRREDAKDERAARHKEWLDSRGDVDTGTETRRVNTGGTDGVVGAEIPAKGSKPSAAERIALAKNLSGRDDITTAKQADEILAAAGAVGSDNDDRSRDQAIDQTANAPLPDANTDI